MAEDQDDRTEAASERRLQQAFDEGQVPVGRDVAAVAGLIGGTVAIAAVARALRDGLVLIVGDVVSSVDRGSPAMLLGRLAVPLALTFVVLGGAALASAVATLSQTRGGFWPELALPDLTRLGGGRLKRLFGLEVWADVGLGALKVLVIGLAAWSAARDVFLTLPNLLQVSTGAILPELLGPLARTSVKVLAAMAFMAGLDLAVTRYRFAARMRMTREETKREMKEDEGDPLIRSRRRRRHRELAKGRAAVEVPRADALVVNPTHIAIAIRYRRDEGRAPRVTAKGKGALAEHMRDLARSNGVPIVQDIPLARLLFKRVKVGREVPAETYRAVAAVLAFVYRLTGKQASRGGGAA